METVAFQSRYADRFSHCIGCGRLNERGMHIHSFWDETGEEAVCRYTPHTSLSGGWEHVVNGGIIGLLIDCHSAGTAAAAQARRRGLATDEPLPRFVTATLKVDYPAPTPVGAEVELRARVRSLEGRKAWVDCTVRVGDTITARGEALMIEVKDQ